MFLNINNEKKYFLLIVIFCFFLTLISMFDIFIHKIIFYIIFLILFILIKQERECIIFASMPFASIIPMREIIILYIILEILKKKIRLEKNSTILVLILCIIEIFAEYLHGGTMRGTISLIIFVLGTTIICSKSYTSKSKDLFNKTFIISFLGATISIIYSTIKAYNYDISKFLNIRFGLISYGENVVNIGTNGIGLLCLMSIAFLLIDIYEKRNVKKIDILLIIYFVFIGLLTQSRAYLLGLILLIFFAGVLLIKEKKIKIHHVVVGIIIGSTIFCVYTNKFAVSYNQFYSRFIGYEDITNGRAELNAFYLEHIFDELEGGLFGYGLEAYNTYLGADNTAHNAIIEILAAWGLIGAIVVFMWFFCIIFYQIKDNTKLDSTSILPILIFAIMVQSTRIFKTLIPIMYFTLCVVSFRKVGGRKANEDNVYSPKISYKSKRDN